MKNTENSISLEEAAARRGVSKRRITQQVAEGGWGIRKIARGRYVIAEDDLISVANKDSLEINEALNSNIFPDSKEEDRPLNDEEIDWLLNEACYEIGTILPNDLRAMGNSLKNTYEALKNYGDLNKLKLEESAWGFIAVESIIEVFEGRENRKDSSV